MRIIEPILSAFGMHFSGAPNMARPSASPRNEAPVRQHTGTASQHFTADFKLISTMRPSEFWRGHSGRLYRHEVYTLLTCPGPTRGVYVLASRDARGRAVPVFTGVAGSAAPTLNLAHIRRRAVTLGASEVHILEIPQATGSLRLRRIVHDLRAGFAQR
jgi:hypothetical protein